MIQVRLKPGHPTGIYHRAGLEFNKRDTVELSNPDPKVLKRLKEDPWLEVSGEESQQPPPGPFDGLTVEQLKEKAEELKVEIPAGSKKADIVALLVRATTAGEQTTQ